MHKKSVRIAHAAAQETDLGLLHESALLCLAQLLLGLLIRQRIDVLEGVLLLFLLTLRGCLLI